MGFEELHGFGWKGETAQQNVMHLILLDVEERRADHQEQTPSCK
jgi:hypothetical protein